MPVNLTPAEHTAGNLLRASAEHQARRLPWGHCFATQAQAATVPQACEGAVHDDAILVAAAAFLARVQLAAARRPPHCHAPARTAGDGLLDRRTAAHGAGGARVGVAAKEPLAPHLWITTVLADEASKKPAECFALGHVEQRVLDLVP